MADGVQRKFALIVNGDPQEQRHFENVDHAVKALRAEDSTYQIAVASTRRPSLPVTSYLPPNATNLKTLIEGFKGKIDDDDLLVVYVTGHGEKGKEGAGCAVLPDGCLSNKIFRDQLKGLPYGKRFVAMDNCYSGAAVPLFADEKTVMVTAGSPGEQISCQNFSPFLWDEKAPDPDGDGVVTIAERYRHAIKQGQALTFSNYYSTIRSFSLSGKEATNPPFPPQVVTVENEEQFKRELGRLEPDQLALVMFSAEWCAPCKEYLPTFEKLAREYGGQFLMIHANRPKEDFRAWEEYGVREMPAVAFIDSRGGRLVVRHDYWGHPKRFLQWIPLMDLSEKMKAQYVLQLPEVKKFTEKLEGLLKDPNPKAKEKIGTLLSSSPIDRPSLLSYLDKFLKDHSALPRARAAFILGHFGHDTQVLSALKPLLKDPDAQVRLEAVTAILKTTPQTQESKARSPLNPKMLDELKKELTRLQADGNPQLRVGAFHAMLLTLDEKDPDYPAKAASMLFKLFDDPELENRRAGLLTALSILMKAIEEPSGTVIDKDLGGGLHEVTIMEMSGGDSSYRAYKKFKPFLEKIAQKIEEEPKLVDSENLILYLVYSCEEGLRLSCSILLKVFAKGEMSDPKIREIVQSLRKSNDNFNKKGSYLGLAGGNTFQGNPAENLHVGVDAHYSYRWNRFLEWRGGAGFNWVKSSSADEKFDHRLALSTGPALHWPSPLGDTELDPFLSLQAGYFRFLKEESSGIALTAGPGLQIPFSRQFLFEASAQMIFDIPFSGEVRAGLRVPLGVTYHF